MYHQFGFFCVRNVSYSVCCMNFKFHEFFINIWMPKYYSLIFVIFVVPWLMQSYNAIVCSMKIIIISEKMRKRNKSRETYSVHVCYILFLCWKWKRNKYVPTKINIFELWHVFAVCALCELARRAHTCVWTSENWYTLRGVNNECAREKGKINTRQYMYNNNIVYL